MWHLHKLLNMNFAAPCVYRKVHNHLMMFVILDINSRDHAGLFKLKKWMEIL